VSLNQANASLSALAVIRFADGVMRVSTEEARDAAATWQGRLERISGQGAVCHSHGATTHIIARCGIDHKPAF